MHAEQVVAEILDLIECVICLDTPKESSHIFQCENGHIFCEECLEKVKICSVCQCALRKNSRNLMIEKVISILKSYAPPIKKEPKIEPTKSGGLNVNAAVFEPKKVTNENNQQLNFHSNVFEGPKKHISNLEEENKSNIDNVETEEEWCKVVKKNKKSNQPNLDFNNVNKSFAELWKLKDNTKHEMTKIPLERFLVKALIGNGGEGIKKLRSDSKANLSLDDPVQGSNERILNISGTQEQIQKAQKLLQQFKGTVGQKI